MKILLTELYEVIRLDLKVGFQYAISTNQDNRILNEKKIILKLSKYQKQGLLIASLSNWLIFNCFVNYHPSFVLQTKNINVNLDKHLSAGWGGRALFSYLI